MNYYLDTEFHEYAKKPYFGKFGKPINTIELISIGIVCEDGREYYAISKDFDLDAAWDNEWLRENVLNPLGYGLFERHCRGNKNIQLVKGKGDFKALKSLVQKFGKTDKEIAQEIVRFVMPEFTEKSYGGRTDLLNGYWVKDIHQNPKFHAYYADYDWVLFCQLFGRMIDLPKGFPMYCIDLKQECENVFRIDEQVVDYISAVQKTQGRFPALEELTHIFRIGHEELKLLQGYPEQRNEHNALSDARWNLKLHQFLKAI